MIALQSFRNSLGLDTFLLRFGRDYSPWRKHSRCDYINNDGWRIKREARNSLQFNKNARLARYTDESMPATGSQARAVRLYTLEMTVSRRLTGKKLTEDCHVIISSTSQRFKFNIVSQRTPRVQRMQAADALGMELMRAITTCTTHNRTINSHEPQERRTYIENKCTSTIFRCLRTLKPVT